MQSMWLVKAKRKMTIHILGSSGFLGSQLYLYFSERNFQVKGYSSADCDLLSSDSIKESLLVGAEDSVIMASGIARFKENSLESMIKNMSMASNVSRFINENKIGYLVFLSSPDVYGTSINGLINEELPLSPEDYYAHSKYLSEFIFKKCCSDNNIPLLILRVSGIYGPRDHARSTINMLVEPAEEGRMTIFGDGSDKRDFIHTNDFCRIVEGGVEKKIEGILNVATGKSHSINEIVGFIKEFFPPIICFQLSSSCINFNVS